MIKSSIKRWDAVDIDFAPGDRRFGYVVDIQDQKVVVDCGDGAPLTVSNQQVLEPQVREPNFSELLADLLSGRQTEGGRGQTARGDYFDMEAVLQLSPHEPFRWFPARNLFRMVYADYRLVEVQVSNQRVRCVLPEDHVRRLAFGYGHIGRGTILHVLVKERAKVPTDFVLSDKARELWKERFYRYKIVEMRDGYLHYLKARERQSDDSEAMKKFFEENADRIKSEATTQSDFVMDVQPVSSCSIHEIIPEEVMLKIFKMLDTEHQASSRRVCKQWNRWLHLPGIISVIRIDCWEEFELERSVWPGDRDPENDRGRKVAACLFHCLRPDTRKLVLTGSQMWQVLDTMNSLADFLPIQRIPEIVLAGMVEEFACFSEEAHISAGRLNERPSKNVFEFHPTLKRICEWLVLDNVTITAVNCSFAFSSQRWYEHDNISDMLDIKGVSARINLQSAGCAADLWNALEQYCPVVSDESKLLIEYAVHMAGQADCQSKEERDIWALVNKMLYGFETCDPRNQHLPLRKFEEPLDWASVNVESLNKMTLFILNYFLTDCHSTETGRFGYFDRHAQPPPEQTDDENEKEQEDHADDEMQ